MTDDTLKAIALEMGAKPETVKKWRQRGVPYRWRLILLEEAAKRDITIKPAAFEPVGERRAA